MKIFDTCKLILHEYKHEKAEWIVSILLQIMIFTCDLFLLSIVFEIDDIGSRYLERMYKDGYTFVLKGYSAQEENELEDMGFYDLYLGEDGATGTLNTLDGIWIKKIGAVIDGKDIWNEDIDEFLVVIGSFQVTLGTICFIMLIVMLNNISNSFTMKLIRRANYIQMLYQLGCTVEMCKRIYYGFFLFRNYVAIFFAVIINSKFLVWFNEYLYIRFYIDYEIEKINLESTICIFVIVEILMRVAFKKIWSKQNEVN